METKSLPHGVDIKSAAKGEVEAVFSTFNVIDHDGDVTFPGAFEDGAEVVISGYKHAVWSGALPVGKGRIRTTRSEAVLQGQFFLDTTAGRDTFEVVKQLGGRQEWSYGYDVLNPPETGTFDGRKANFLKRLKVHEVSPVFQGAGIGTRTLAVKSLTDAGMDAADAVRLVERTVAVSEYKAAIRPHDTPVTTKAWQGKKVTEDLPAEVSIADLRSVYAWCDPNGDPEQKSSYAFPHHEGPGGEANLRACMLGIAALNNTKCPVPEDDRRGVYNHLAAHLQDGDREAPSLVDAGSTSLKFYDETAAVMAGVSALVDRASEVMALRAKKGKSLASTSVDLLEWLYDDLRRLRTVLDSPQDDAAREYVRFVQSLRHSGEQQ